jgi:sugar lactone lactonase YvrE
MRATLVWDERALLGEGPLWDEREQCLYWVDVDGFALHTYRPGDDGRETERFAARISSVALRENGGLLVAHDRSVSLLDGGALTPLAADVSPAGRTNDGACDPAGRYWFGTVAPEGAPGTGALYRLEPSGDVQRVVDGVDISNGIDWSLDATTMYYVDSLAHSIDAFAYDVTTGTIADRRVLASIAQEDGVPDGLTVDVAGAIWVAIWGGSEVRRYAPDGELLERLALPVRQPSSCVFGGRDLDTLFVTSARTGIDQPAPHDGSLFAADVGVRGRPAFRFAG